MIETSIPSTPIVPNPPGKVKPKAPLPNPSDSKAAVAKGDLKSLRDFNLLQRLRTERGIPARDLVEVVQAIYPKYDKTLHSKVEHGEEYGIRLRADAERALREHFAIGRPSAAHKPKRSKPHRVQVRLSEAVYSLLQQRLARSETTMQDLLEGLILKYIANEGGKP